MIRPEKIKELTNEKIITLLDQELTKFGFKFLKSKSQFVRKENDFNQILEIKAFSQLSLNEQTDQRFLIFDVTVMLEMPNYDKWYFEKLGERNYFYLWIGRLRSQVEVSFEDFDKDSFYTLTASQEFKNNVAFLLIGESAQQKIVPIEDFLSINIPDLVLELSQKSDVLNIYANRKFPSEHMFMLLYGGHTENANEAFKQHFQYTINRIEAEKLISDAEARRTIEDLDKFIKNIHKITNLSFTNPYERTIKVLNQKNDTFDFSDKTKFNETLRLDISQFDVKSVNINLNGDILLFTRCQNIIKLNSKGEIVFRKEIEPRKGFEEISWDVPSGTINGSNDFFVNNYIITNGNEFLELALPLKDLKKGKLQSPYIGDLAFSDKKNAYFILYKDQFITYTKSGELEKVINLEQIYGHKIILEKEWIVMEERDSSHIILDFEGNRVGRYEYGNGNQYFEISANYEYLINFFYSTKSNFYNLTTGKKHTLWAHPTFIKGYKETMYSDINNNFGIDVAKFSPDSKYIVGGAEHGKYVAWTLPKLERIELIPQAEMISLLYPHVVTRLSHDKSEDIVTRAELVELENQTFLKNRGNSISNIIFFEKGDIFITELDYDSFVLSWDRNFKNLTYKSIQGRLNYHAERYLSQKSATELIVYV